VPLAQLRHPDFATIHADAHCAIQNASAPQHPDISELDWQVQRLKQRLQDDEPEPP